MTAKAPARRVTVKLSEVYYDVKRHEGTPWARCATRFVGKSMVASRTFRFRTEEDAQKFKKPKPEDV